MAFMKQIPMYERRFYHRNMYVEALWLQVFTMDGFVGMQQISAT
jgi:heme-degrading monooxygenase HmoA